MQHTPRNIDKIIEEQVRRWELLRQKRKQAEPQPLMTISRQYGSQGAALARLVAQRLEWEVWDQELISAIADHAKAPQTLFESLDEHRRDVIREAIAVFGAQPKVTASDYLRELVRVVRTIGEHGRAVIVGRGAQYILPPDRTLRVRAVAPLAARIRGLVQRKGLTQDQARAALAEVDEDRAAFARESFGRDIDEVGDYDLVVNTGTFSLEQAADVVIAAHRARFER